VDTRRTWHSGQAARRARASLLLAPWLALTACDALVGLDPPVPTRADAAPSDGPAASADDAAQDATSDATATTGDGGPDAGPCTETTCPSGCADLTSDGDNCGACGHGCLGGTCRAGRCLPEVFAVGEPVSLVSDGARLYWTDAQFGTVQSCPVTGCPDGGASVVFVGPGGTSVGIGGIALQNGRLFFAESSSGSGVLYSCPTTGCANASAVFASGWPGGAGAVATDSNNVYWYALSQVLACSLAGCEGGVPTSTAPIMLSLGSTIPWALAAASGDLYFADMVASVGRCSVAGGCACPYESCAFGDMPGPALAIGIGSTAVYWTTAMSGAVLDRPLTDAGPPAGILVSASGPGDLALDAENVYFTSLDDGGTIYRCAVGGCNLSATVVASGLGPLGGLAVDAQRIYAVVEQQSSQGPLVTTVLGDAIVWVAK
jgi:hypothetical protein